MDGYGRVTAVVAVALLVATAGCVGGPLGGGSNGDGDGGAGDAGTIAIETEPAEDLNASWRYVYVEPRNGETLPAGTTVNVTLTFTINNQTNSESLVATLEESVESGTKVYVGSGNTDFGLSVGETPGEQGVIRPDRLPSAVDVTVRVDTGGNTASETLTFGDEG